MQRKHFKQDVFRKVANFGESELLLKKGDTIDKQYRSNFVVNDLGADGSYSRQAITDTNEQLVINKEKEVSFYIRELDELQSNYDTVREYAEDAAKYMGNQMDGDFQAEVANADWVVDMADFGGTSGEGVTASATNVDDLFLIADMYLNRANVALDNRFIILSSNLNRWLQARIIAKDSGLGDKVAVNGYLGQYLNFDCYLSNANYWTARLEMGTQATDTDTVVINGVTLTYETSTLTAAGMVKSETSAAVCIDNLVAMINNSEELAASTLGTAYYELTAANRALLKNITATDGTTYMTLAATGYGYVAVSETLSATADIWTTTKQIQHIMAGRKGCSSMVVQKFNKMTIKDRTGYIGKDIVSWGAYGIKTFDDGDAELVDIALRSDAY